MSAISARAAAIRLSTESTLTPRVLSSDENSDLSACNAATNSSNRASTSGPVNPSPLSTIILVTASRRSSSPAWMVAASISFRILASTTVNSRATTRADSYLLKGSSPLNSPSGYPSYISRSATALTASYAQWYAGTSGNGLALATAANDSIRATATSGAMYFLIL